MPHAVVSRMIFLSLTYPREAFKHDKGRHPGWVTALVVV